MELEFTKFIVLIDVCATFFLNQMLDFSKADKFLNPRERQREKQRAVLRNSIQTILLISHCPPPGSPLSRRPRTSGDRGENRKAEKN